MKLIFDIGFEDGKDTAYYLYKGFNVVAVDANPKLIELGKIKFEKEVKEGRLKLLNVGISDTPGIENFYINACAEWSSFDERLGKRMDPKAYPIPVKCITMEELLTDYGTPFYIKIDIEGYDIVALKSMLNKKHRKPQYISIEAAAIKWLDTLEELGYKQFKLIDQPKVIKQSTTDWEFKHGSSGNFGEDTPCEWMSANEIRALFNFLYDPYNASADSWYDIHAK